METFGERIKEVLKRYDLNVNQFTKKIGFTNNTIIGKIVNDSRRNPSLETIQHILRAFPEIDRDWLLLGDGSITGSRPKSGIKYYPGILTPDTFKSDPQSFMKIDGFEDCDVAVQNNTSDMEPLFSKGDILLCRKVDLHIYGNPYIVMIKNMALVRRLFECDKEGFICLKTEDEKHGNLRFEKKSILDLYLILGKLSRL